MLNRRGNKSKLLPSLLPLFPAGVVTFIDLFAGSLSVSVAMLNRAKYVISNDADRDVSNLYHVWRDRPAELADALETVPYHSDVLRRFRDQPESDDVWRAVAFIYKSNFSFLANGETLIWQKQAEGVKQDDIAKRVGWSVSKVKNYSALEKIDEQAWKKVTEIINGRDFSIDSDVTEKVTPVTFFTENLLRDIIQLTPDQQLELVSGLADGTLTKGKFKQQAENYQTRNEMLAYCRAMLGEIDAEFVEMVTTIGERRNIANRKTEILVTNYAPQPQQASIFGLAGVQLGAKKAAIGSWQQIFAH